MPRLKLNGKILVILLLILMLLGLMRFTGLERDSLTLPEVWIRDLLAPLQSGVTAVTGRVKGTVEQVSEYRRLAFDNQQLRAQLDELLRENNELAEEHMENVRLKRLLDFKEQLADKLTMVPARVISRSTAYWYQTLVIDAGASEGIVKDMAVVVPDGLVGRVIAVSRNSAEVLTIQDKEGAVGAMLQISRFPGVVEGINGAAQRLQMIHLPHDAPVNPGETVITSGLDDIFPKGIRIGYVKDVTTEPNGLMKRATVIPFVDFRRLEEVMVVTEVQRRDADVGLDTGGDIFGGSGAADNVVTPAASGD